MGSATRFQAVNNKKLGPSTKVILHRQILSFRCTRRHKPTTFGTAFIKIGQAVEAGQCLKEIGLETSSF